MMARSLNAPSIGRIQKRKTNVLQIIIFGLQRAAGPYRWVSSVVLDALADVGFRPKATVKATCLAVASARSSVAHLNVSVTDQSVAPPQRDLYFARRQHPREFKTKSTSTRNDWDRRVARFALAGTDGVWL